MSGRLRVDAHVTATTAARAIGIKPTRVWKWAQRGLLRPVAHTKGGRPLYRLGDVYALHARIHPAGPCTLDDQVS